MRFDYLKWSLTGATFVLFGTMAIASVPRNAYIKRPVSSTDDLVQHITSDPEVFSRYSRHFSMNREELIEYVGSLRLSKTQKDGYYVVYNVPQSGELRSKMRALKKGTRVFVDKSGTAILMWVCGNPLTHGPKKETTTIAFSETGEVTSSIVEVPVQVDGDIAMTETVLMEPSYQPTEIVPSAVYTPPTVTGGGSDIQILGGGFPWQILPAIGLIGATGGNNPGPPPVPEPATIAILAAGATTLVARRRKKSS